MSSFPLCLGVSREGIAEALITRALPDGAFGEIDAAPEGGESDSTSDGVDGDCGGHDCQCDVVADGEPICGEDRVPVRCEVLEARAYEDDAHPLRYIIFVSTCFSTTYK